MAILAPLKRRNTADFQVEQVLAAAAREKLSSRIQSITSRGRPSAFGAIDENGRRVGRERVYRVASAIFDVNSQTTCRIVDQSYSGLRLSFGSKINCPDEFALTIPTLRFIGIVRKVWQSETETGVSIVRWNDAA